MLEVRLQNGSLGSPHRKEKQMGKRSTYSPWSRLPALIRYAHWIAILGLAPVDTQSARAAAIYTYTGNNFTFADGPYSTSDFISVSFTLPTALGDNDALVTITPSAFSFSDQLHTITNANIGTGSTNFLISTDGNGNITAWVISAINDLPNVPVTGIDTEFTGFIPNQEDMALFNLFQQAGAAAGEGYNMSDPGTWELTPEPGSSSLVLLGILGIAFVTRKRRTRHAPLPAAKRVA
jgi:hypothetical protein